MSNFPDQAALNYRAAELHDVGVGEQPATYLIQVRSWNGHTKWLNITQAEFDKIKEVLTLGNVGGADS